MTILKTMFRKLSLLLILLSSTISFARPAFQHGSNFQIVEFHGRLRVQCRDNSGQTDSAYHNCREEFMLPTAFSRFINEGSQANKVAFESQTADGKTIKKSVRFFPTRGFSQEVNLGINTLTQTALLRMGENIVSYKFLKDREVLEEGGLSMKVEKGQDVSCRNGFEHSNDLNDCRHYSRQLCNRYLKGDACEGSQS